MLLLQLVFLAITELGSRSKCTEDTCTSWYPQNRYMQSILLTTHLEEYMKALEIQDHRHTYFMILQILL